MQSQDDTVAPTLAAGDEDEVDELYQADLLRQLEVDWLNQRAYASLRLRILGDDDDDDDSEEEDGDDEEDDDGGNDIPARNHRIYHLMEQFLMAESYLFRDFFKVLKQGNNLTVLEDDNRFACLRIDHVPEDLPVPQPLSASSSPTSIPSPLPGVLPPPHAVHDDQLPLVTLFLPYPELFDDHILPLFYQLNHDTTSWARQTLTPSTLGKMFLNLSRLECRPDWILSCVRYFAEIRENRDRDPLSWTALQEDQDAFEALTSVHANARDNHLL
ncbi:hypothetical protein BGZ73_004952 [Actinomortierella ambigua]|nr:hypothetical protein BGZ73_004952 [Actinomortierella ambigua]